MNIAIILDWIMSIMLIISITYSWRLNKKIMDFKNSKGEFFQIIKMLDDTIIRAEKNIDELKNLSYKTSNSLGNELDKAKTIADDLAFMTDRASMLADNLEESISFAKKYESVYKNYNIQRNNNSNISQKTDISNNYKQEIEPKKAAIESLLAKISAVRDRKETIDN